MDGPPIDFSTTVIGTGSEGSSFIRWQGKSKLLLFLTPSGKIICAGGEAVFCVSTAMAYFDQFRFRWTRSVLGCHVKRDVQRLDEMSFFLNRYKGATLNMSLWIIFRCGFYDFSANLLERWRCLLLWVGIVWMLKHPHAMVSMPGCWQ